MDSYSFQTHLMGMEQHVWHPHLGIDIGRVIIGTAALDGTADTTFLSGGEASAMATPAATGSFEAIARLVRAFEGRVWLVSKCGPRIQARSRRWLRHHRFHERTGLAESHLRFCRKRHEKRAHAAELSLGFFVDDRTDVLRHLVGLVPRLYLFGHQKPGSAPLADAKPVLDWEQAERALLEDLDVLRRNGLDEPDAVGAPVEEVSVGRHSSGRHD